MVLSVEWKATANNTYQDLHYSEYHKNQIK